ncbi:MAG: hypothetical protein JNL99_06910 [Zoogloea sp.]|nr:hypothetical protein [Zoogloea sp.]
MKKSLLARMAAGFVVGGVLAVVPMGTAQAEYNDFYDSVKALTDKAYTQGSGDMYDSMEPTSAGPQGPVRSDMMKDAGAYDSRGYRYDAGKSSGWSQWSDLSRQMGPIGGDGTN